MAPRSPVTPWPTWRGSRSYIPLVQRRLSSHHITSTPSSPIYFTSRVNPLTPSYKLNATTGVQFLHLDHYITKVKTRYRTTYNQWTAANEATLRLEEELDIESRWTVDSPQYQQALALMTERKYRKSIRLAGASCGTAAFRLTQLGMSGIGKLQ